MQLRELERHRYESFRTILLFHAYSIGVGLKVDAFGNIRGTRAVVDSCHSDDSDPPSAVLANNMVAKIFLAIPILVT